MSIYFAGRKSIAEGKILNQIEQVLKLRFSPKQNLRKRSMQPQLFPFLQLPVENLVKLGPVNQ